MLVLSRSVGETVIIADLDLTIEVLTSVTSRTQVTLGLTAPEAVRFVRKEIANEVAKKSRPQKGGTLSLSRKVGGVVFAHLPSGEMGQIVVAKIKGNKVRLGFAFPQSFQILRKELLNA